MKISLLLCGVVSLHLTVPFVDARPPENIQEALECMFYVTTYDKRGKVHAHGSAFLVQEGNTQWIYSNAHVIEGAKRIEFRDSDKKRVKGLGRFACYDHKQGVSDLEIGGGSHRFGADGIKLELKEARDIAFELNTDKAAYRANASVVTLGDNGGKKKMDVLEGRVTASNGAVVLSTCATEHGSSGGALLAGKTLKVIGLNTWGFDGQTPLEDAIWQQGINGKVAGASIVTGIRWLEMKVSDFLKSGELSMKYRDTVRMLSLIYRLVPQEGGFKIDTHDEVAMNITFEDAFKRWDHDPIFAHVIRLNRRLHGRDTGIGINNMELVRIYARTLTQIRQSYVRQKKSMQGDLAPYFLIENKQSGAAEAGEWYYNGLGGAETWFSKKSKVGGKMPFGRWLNLRPLSELGQSE